MYRWLFFMVTEIEQPLWRIARHTFVYPEERRLPADIEIAAGECVTLLSPRSVLARVARQVRRGGGSA